MATTTRPGRFFRGRRRVSGLRVRVLTASATRLRLKDRDENAFMKKLRQGWQSDAWAYYDSIGELRYGTNFLANCMSRMKLFPAAYPVEGEDDNPAKLTRIEGVPPEVLQACSEAQRALGNGRLALSALLHSYSTNITVAGECFLLGEMEPGAPDRWTIRSTEELVWTDEAPKLRELPGDGTGGSGYVDLDPNATVVSRIWLPHPKFRRIATSPYRAILDEMESLQIMRRVIRANGRSRLASRGILALPLELEIKTPENDEQDPETQDFLGELTEAMMEGLAEEGTAASAVPIAVQGPADVIKEIHLIDFATRFDAEGAKVREELVGVIASGLDLPKSVVLGIQDMNHWNAWQVSDETFRSHVEPHVITGCDSLTGAYLRPFLEGKGIGPEWVNRVLFWYDPSELVVHPDRSKDALDLYKEIALSGDSLRREMGFDETDKPSPQEVEQRQFEHIKNFPLNLLMEWARRLDPTLIVPPITQSGTVPGIKPGGVDPGAPPAPAGAPPAGPTGTVPAGPPPGPGVAPTAPSNGQPGPPPVPVTAAGDVSRETRARARKLSRRLAAVDRDLRVRLQVAANAAMRRKLEQAGARTRSALINHPNETVKQALAHNTNERLTAHIGKTAIAAAGVDPEALLSDDWSGLRDQFLGWTKAAQEQALAMATRLGELDAKDEAVLRARQALEDDAGKAWGMLESSLDHLGHALMYSPDPNIGPDEWATLNPDTLVPSGTIRAALAVAGGEALEDLGVIPGSESTIALGTPVGQIGTGSTIEDLLQSAGAEREEYEWQHGPSLNPFEPHDALDGTQFSSFDDDVLANDEGFPDNSYYFPGDHTGCLCDFAPLWVPPSEGEEAAGAAEEEPVSEPEGPAE